MKADCSCSIVQPIEEKKLVRKIDLMILPYLAVCYAFFYIDKTTLSYAAIFGIKDDLDLVGTEYSWLSSIFYFGFLAWALPTNLLLQRLPIGRYLGSSKQHKQAEPNAGDFTWVLTVLSRRHFHVGCVPDDPGYREELCWTCSSTCHGWSRRSMF